MLRDTVEGSAWQSFATPRAPVERSGLASVTLAEAQRWLGGRSGLVLDTDPKRFGCMYVSLAHVGCRVRLARRREQATQMLAHELAAVDLALVSSDMRDVERTDVASVVRWLREQPKCRTAIVVVLATADSRRERRRVLDAGGDAYFARPVDPRLFAQDLVAVVPQLRTAR